jgi:uncharacterized protein YcaQ
MPTLGLAQLRRYAVARTLFPLTTLRRAIHKLGFVQADPIRAPARAQDLTLHQRVRTYRAGDLERRYAELAIEEDFFINYGFLPRAQYQLMHPRVVRRLTSALARQRAAALLEFVASHGSVHPRVVEAHFAHGSVRNYWGGVSSATTHMLDDLHYRGLLRVARRERGVRIYTLAVHEQGPPLAAGERQARIDALVDLVVHAYAPLPRASLGPLVGRLRFGVPQWRAELKSALQRATQRLAHAHIDGVDWYWPATERPTSTRYAEPEQVRLLAPFDPIVWDRRRFQLLWGWAYRFEAYTPAAKRKLGYYALPLLWRDQVIGWANVSVTAGQLHTELGFVDRRPREAAFARELDAALERMRRFLTPVRP